MDSAKLIDELIRDEGLRLRPYMDSATPPRITIGVGRNLSDIGISKDEAFRMLHNDVERVTADLDQHLPWWKNLTEPRQHVLANMAFNLGIKGLLNFHHTLALMETGRFREAADEMLLSKWASQVGVRATRLAEQMRGD